MAEVKIIAAQVEEYYETVPDHKAYKTAIRFGISIVDLEEFLFLRQKISHKSKGPIIPEPMLRAKISQKRTVRQIADDLGVSKSSVHYAIVYYWLIDGRDKA